MLEKKTGCIITERMSSGEGQVAEQRGRASGAAFGRVTHVCSALQSSGELERTWVGSLVKPGDLPRLQTGSSETPTNLGCIRSARSRAD
jgi:hypothetical protein